MITLIVRPRPNVKLFMRIMDRPTRSVRLLQTDRKSEDRLRDKRRLIQLTGSTRPKFDV